MTGKTIEQFIYNNYFANLNDIYNGNYPWREDVEILQIEMLSFLILSITLLGAIIILISLLKKHNFD